jgi:hypothetical protein
MRPVTTADVEKSPLDEVEDVHSSVSKEESPQRRADYSGASEKTDPEEIALVRKLDWRIMPTLWAMYFL